MSQSRLFPSSVSFALLHSMISVVFLAETSMMRYKSFAVVGLTSEIYTLPITLGHELFDLSPPLSVLFKRLITFLLDPVTISVAPGMSRSCWGAIEICHCNSEHCNRNSEYIYSSNGRLLIRNNINHFSFDKIYLDRRGSTDQETCWPSETFVDLPRWPLFNSLVNTQCTPRFSSLHLLDYFSWRSYALYDLPPLQNLSNLTLPYVAIPCCNLPWLSFT